MMTLSAMSVRTAAMMEAIRMRAEADAWDRFDAAARNYYRQGYDSGELVAVIRELESYGADTEDILDRELAIREEVRL